MLEAEAIGFILRLSRKTCAPMNRIMFCMWGIALFAAYEVVAMVNCNKKTPEAILSKLQGLRVPQAGLEPARTLKRPLDFKSNVSTNSTTAATNPSGYLRCGLFETE